MSAALMEKRARLASLLRQAAELEHGVMCQYIFAAVTMKKTHDEGGVSWEDLERMRVWRGKIMMVAREEMEHLGLVINLLTAVGESPVMQRRDFPFDVAYGGMTQELTLEPFGVGAIRRFALIEMPEKLERDSAGWRLLSSGDPHFSPKKYDLISKLYDEVESLIGEIPEKMLFIGPPAAQFTTSEIFPGSIRGIDLKGSPAYNVSMRAVTDRASALAVVNQIKEEGEGAKEHGGEGSHFAIFLDILQQLQAVDNPAFRPARPSAANPSLHGSGKSVVSHPVTRRVMALFDGCYETLVLALMRYFAHTDESTDDLDALQQASFFPMMTTVIRPLAECLTLLPAAERGKARAGPSFVLPQGLQFLPHRDAAFELIAQKYDALVDMAHQLSTDASAKKGPPELRPLAERLRQIYETLWRSRMNFRTSAGLEAPNG